jgi:hypothetical protein
MQKNKCEGDYSFLDQFPLKNRELPQIQEKNYSCQI